MEFQATRAILGNGDILFYQEAAAESEVLQWVAVELGKIQNCKKIFMAELGSEFDNSIAASLAPHLHQTIHACCVLAWNSRT